MSLLAGTSIVGSAPSEHIDVQPLINLSFSFLWYWITIYSPAVNNQQHFLLLVVFCHDPFPFDCTGNAAAVSSGTKSLSTNQVAHDKHTSMSSPCAFMARQPATFDNNIAVFRISTLQSICP
jgi:hypothetical protein